MISAAVPDWSREKKKFFSWSPSKSLLASIRSYQRYSVSRLPWYVMLRKLAVLRHRFWSVVTGADIPVNTRIGGGLSMPHPNGIVIHSRSVIGPNCLIFQQVTIGTRGTDNAPTIGGHVDIGAGAKILGGVVIEDHARIGANAVVLVDIPSGGLAVGVPSSVASQSVPIDLS